VPPGSTTPPTGVNLTVTTSNASPLVDSTVTITASATIDGATVPNGTAVEFVSSGGALTGGETAIVRTTTNGSASVTLTSSAPGPIRVTATLNNVSKSVDVSFQSAPVIPPPTSTNPTISGVTPAIGRPAGGEVIRITGTNFRAPVRVLFRTGGALPVEGSVVAVTETTIDVITPPVNLGAGQQLPVDVIVLTQAGSTTEQRVERTGAFTFRNQQLTPIISTVTPNSGPVIGGTRVTIIGEGFQEPVQVLFNTAEARVLNVTYNQILVETPAGRDTAPTGSGVVTGPVTVSVRNVNSNLAASMDAGFHYKADMQITAAGPGEGLFTGGTRVQIDGIGFVAPVAVTIGGVAAQPINVTGTRIIAITSGVDVEGCGDVTGPIIVTNVVNGDQATGPDFIYRVIEPTILSVSQDAVRGGSLLVTVANAIGFPRLTLGNATLSVTNTTVNPDGTTTFTATVPNTLTLTTEACPAVSGVTRALPTAFTVTYTSLATGCTDSLTNGVTVVPPPNTPTITISPASYGPFTSAITPAVPDPDGVGPLTGTPASVAPSPSQTVTLTNSGTGTLTVNSVAKDATPACARFNVSSPSTPTSLAACDPFPITSNYAGTTTAGTEQCTVTINTSAGVRTLTLTGTSQ
jgi:hypothetical protein